MCYLAPTIDLKADVPTRFGFLGKAKVFPFQKVITMCADSAHKLGVVLFEKYPLFGNEAVSLPLWNIMTLFASCAILRSVKISMFHCLGWTKSEQI